MDIVGIKPSGYLMRSFSPNFYPVFRNRYDNRCPICRKKLIVDVTDHFDKDTIAIYRVRISRITIELHLSDLVGRQTVYTIRIRMIAAHQFSCYYFSFT